jgi:hypothetical protein
MADNPEMRRALLLALVAGAALLTASAATPRPTVSSLLLGVAGDPARMQTHTGQPPGVRSVFLGWEQGWHWGTRFEKLLQQMGPVPMIHIGVGSRAGGTAITPLQIAQGAGDGYLAALNQGMAAYGGLVYMRLLAEMNNYRVKYAAFTLDGRPTGAGFTPAAYRKAFARMALALRGGTPAAVNAALARAGLPAFRGGELAENGKDTLRVIWNPLAGGRPVIRANAPQRFYPGDRYVDVIGNDMYARGAVFSAAKNEALYAFARAHRKPYAFPEWGLEDLDHPGLVQYVCRFIRAKAGIELAAYYEARAGSKYDLGPKPVASRTYRACLTPLAAA